MKKIIFTFVLATIFCYANGTIHNVDQSPNRPSGYFADLQLAINTALEGDTIFLYPSSTTYGNITITKRIHLFGIGYNGTQSGASVVSYIGFDTATSPASNPSGSSIQGLTLDGSLVVEKPNITNILIKGNFFNHASQTIKLNHNCAGWLIDNNYIRGYINVYNNSLVIIKNNIFYGSYEYPIINSSSSSVLFSHNLVMNFKYFYNVYNCTITDNIFVCSGNSNQSYMANNRFFNNLSWRSTLTPYVLPPEGNSGSNNISNQDPQFETASSSGTFDFTKNYHLKSTSPAKNAASDGTDIGPYGGNSPFVWGGTFTIPRIYQTMITNPVINQSTPLNVNIKANKAGL